MCKLHGYRYSCGHLVRYRLSRCRGVFTRVRRRLFKASTAQRDTPRIAACASECYIVIVSSSPCGSCQYEQFKDRWRERISDADRSYRAALDEGRRTGLRVVCRWDDEEEGGGGGGGGEGPYGSDETTAAGMTREQPDSNASGTGSATAKEHRQQQQRVKRQIQRRSRALDALRSEFSADHWSVRSCLPTLDRRAYSAPAAQSPTFRITSPLRNEVRPHEIDVQSGREEDDSDHVQYSTFQAFFMNRYGGRGNGSGSGLDGAWDTRTSTRDPQHTQDQVPTDRESDFEAGESASSVHLHPPQAQQQQHLARLNTPLTLE